MASRIVVSPENVWDWMEENAYSMSLREGRVIAEDLDCGIQIRALNRDGNFKIALYMDSDPVSSEIVRNREECEETARELYDDYLNNNAVNTIILNEFDKKSKGMSLTKIDETKWDDMVSERETELDEAFMELMYVLEPNIGELVDDTDNLFEELKDHVCEYLYATHGISVYRPMVLEDEDGEDSYEEYPYPEIDIEW